MHMINLLDFFFHRYVTLCLLYRKVYGKDGFRFVYTETSVASDAWRKELENY